MASQISGKELAIERKKLLAKISSGSPAPQSDIKKLALRDIQCCEAVFQHRGLNVGGSQGHIRELVKSLKRYGDKPLAPITVYWIGDGFYCIDGHHRLSAYHEVGYKHKIPVIVFKGSLDEAIATALSKNSKDKLSMCRKEKTEAAWRLVTTTELSKAVIASSANVSDRTVGYMRATFSDLLKDKHQSYIASLSWSDAMRLAKGDKLNEDYDNEDYRYQKQLALANRLSKHFGNTLINDAENLLGALEIYSPKLIRDIEDLYGVTYEEDEESEIEENTDF